MLFLNEGLQHSEQIHAASHLPVEMQEYLNSSEFQELNPQDYALFKAAQHGIEDGLARLSVVNSVANITSTIPFDASIFDASETVVVSRRSPNNPLVNRYFDALTNTDHLPGKDGKNINGAHVIRVPSWIEHPLGRYYLYFAHHSGIAHAPPF